MSTVKRRLPTFVTALVLLAYGLYSQAQTGDDSLKALIAQWDHAQFEVPESQREGAFADLLEQLDQRVAAEPQQARLLMWRGLTKASLAGAKGGLGALSLVKSAKKDLERAIALGAGKAVAPAYTTLGSLYDQVPGWPIGFGNDDLAEKNLKKGLALTPDDIDAHYFYADFLHNQGHERAAVKTLQDALACPPRVDRPVADQARRRDIEKRLSNGGQH